MPVTNSDGDRIYVKLDSESTWEQSIDNKTGQMSLQSMFAKTWEEARKIVSYYRGTCSWYLLS